MAGINAAAALCWQWRAGHCSPLQGVVHVELDRVGGHAEAGDFLHFQFNVSVQHGIAEHAATGQELAVLVQIVQGLVQAVTHGGDLRVFFRRQVVQVLGRGIARMDLTKNPISQVFR